jgi:hypothetical protein
MRGDMSLQGRSIGNESGKRHESDDLRMRPSLTWPPPSAHSQPRSPGCFSFRYFWSPACWPGHATSRPPLPRPRPRPFLTAYRSDSSSNTASARMGAGWVAASTPAPSPATAAALGKVVFKPRPAPLSSPILSCLPKTS